MIKLNGTLVIKEIKGANGKFCVGDLTTPEGDFKVKEPILDQFAEGRYEGEFTIDRFYLSSYVWRGKSTTDIRAKVVDFNLAEAEEGRQEETPSEPDPMAIEPSANTPLAASTDAPVPAVLIQENSNHAPEFQALLDLFGADMAVHVRDQVEVKLDPTVDRALFRRQRDRLKELGYVFDAKSQSWAKTKEGECS